MGKQKEMEGVSLFKGAFFIGYSQLFIGSWFSFEIFAHGKEIPNFVKYMFLTPPHTKACLKILSPGVEHGCVFWLTIPLWAFFKFGCKYVSLALLLVAGASAYLSYSVHLFLLKLHIVENA